jgi:putative oxidoreductase
MEHPLNRQFAPTAPAGVLEETTMNVLTNFEKNTSMTPYGIVALRWTLALYWGLDWYYQVLNQGMPATERLFVSLGYPAWFAWGEITFLVIAVIGLVLGLYVRTLSLLLLVILIPAMKLWIPNGIWAIHGGYEFPLLWILLQIIQALLGPGPMSVKTLSWLDAVGRPHGSTIANLLKG